MLFALYGLAGICACAALHHGLIGSRRPVDRTHLLFAALCVLISCYVIARAGSYRADSALLMVAARRLEASFALVFFAVFPWFIAQYSGLRQRWPLAGMSTLFAAVLAANLLLPYGVTYVDLPEFRTMTLPWGEEVADLRVPRRGAWYAVAWLGILLVFAYTIYACVRQYRQGAHRRALALAIGAGVFIASTLFTLAVHFGLVRSFLTSEFGFVALVIVMTFSLTREMRERERRMLALFDNVPAAVYVKDLAGRYLLANRRFEELFGIRAASVAGKTDRDLFPAPQAGIFEANDRQVLEQVRGQQFEEVVGDAARTYVSLRFPLLDEDGRPYAVCGASTDVTEARKAASEISSLRRQVWHADRVARTGALSAAIAHELNQPLAAILSNAQAGLRLLARSDPDLREVREILSDIVRDDKRAGTVITGLRGMLSPQDTERTRVDLSETVREILELLRSELIARQIELAADLAPGCVAHANRGQIQQVLLNLVMNAIEAMMAQPAGTRRLHFAVPPAREGGALSVAVRDSGPGIPPQEIGKVFDAFYTTKPTGMGMGLAVSRSIVEAHGGAIRVDPNADRGVTFSFTLPQNTELS